ncbi:hypothetical protein Rhe02_38780 [Rhizocola hellebori]|uniref:Uncharacterized protein n=1 Tax=Rhizocola hellebori TaxID=1392758 RepID=A0A8J3Q9X5_9ACTN|nr:hypothetical protein [Rhizocola hellebori]GIH05811.1 hypothetical protein Rhe02_38780 [Rhizocola hellebori]
MTSEPSQHGWQPADRYEPTDEAPNQRGFGLFDAPAAPDEFPVFTPYNGSARESDAQFPPDSDAGSPPFPGFPSDDIASPSEWASSLSDHYVPAPAVMPIPGVRHDPENAAPSWSTSSDFDLDPYPAPAAELDREENSGGASSWAAFAAGESKKAPANNSGGAWSEPSAPSWEDHPLNEQRREEPVRHESPWGDSAYGTPPPPEPEMPRPVSPSVGSARVSAAAPVQHRPEVVQHRPDVPEVPPMPQRPAGRVYGSATVGAPVPSDPMAEPAPYAPPPPPAAPPVPAGPPVRASARATVNVAKPNPGEAPPQITRSSTVYGSATAAPASPAAPMAPPPPAAPMGAPSPLTPPGHAAPPRLPGRQHAFGDLLGPAGAGAAEAPQMMAPPTALASAPIPGQRMPGGPAGPGAVPVGAPPPPAMGAMAPAAAQRASASVPGNREPSQAAFDQFKPAGTDPAPAEPKPERKGGIIVGVLVGCVALLAIAFGGLFLVDKIFNGPSFAVGDCVKQSDTEAVKADCGESGAFQVKEAVTSPDQCQDQSQPHVQQKDQILCLAPVAAAQTGPTPSAAPTLNQ